MRLIPALFLTALLAAPVSAQERAWGHAIGEALPHVSQGPAAFAAKNLVNPAWGASYREAVLSPIAHALSAKGLTAEAFAKLPAPERAAALQAALEAQVAQIGSRAKGLVDDVAKVNSGEAKFEPEGAEDGLRGAEDLLLYSSPYLDAKLLARVDGARQALRLRLDSYQQRTLRGRMNDEASKLAPREDDALLAPHAASGDAAAFARLAPSRRARGYAAIDQALQKLSAETQPRIDSDSKLSAEEKARLKLEWSAGLALAATAAKQAPDQALAAKLRGAVRPVLAQFWRFHDEDFAEQFGRGKRPAQSPGLALAHELELLLVKAAPRGPLPDIGPEATRLELTDEVLASLIELKPLAADYISTDPHLTLEEKWVRASAWGGTSDYFIVFKRQARPDLTLQEAAALRESLKIPISRLKESLQLDPLLAADPAARKALTLEAERLAECLARLASGTPGDGLREGLWRAAAKLKDRLFIRAGVYCTGRGSPYAPKKGLALLGQWSQAGAAVVGQDAGKARRLLEPLLPEFRAMVAKDPELKPSEREAALRDCDRLLDLLKRLGA